MARPRSAALVQGGFRITSSAYPDGARHRVDVREPLLYAGDVDDRLHLIMEAVKDDARVRRGGRGRGDDPDARRVHEPKLAHVDGDRPSGWQDVRERRLELGRVLQL